MPAILHSITIKAPPSKIFKALTTEKGLKAWWTDDVKAKPKKGSAAQFGFFKRSTIFRMKITTLEPDKKLVWTCLGNVPDWRGTKVEWVLKKTRGGTNLRFAHKNWRKASDHFARCNTTWGALMHLLRDHAEGKKVKAYFRN